MNTTSSTSSKHKKIHHIQHSAIQYPSFRSKQPEITKDYTPRHHDLKVSNSGAGAPPLVGGASC
jgi:hypothetical protein